MSQFASQFHKLDGDRAPQASITVTYTAESVPTTKTGHSEDYFPLVPPQAPSVIMRGDLAITEVDKSHMTTSHGKTDSGCFASLAGRPKPEKGHQDTYCKQFMVVGVVKNNETDPSSAMFAPNGGVPRIGSTQVAVQVGGAVTVEYNNPKQVAIAGDPLIWTPPENGKIYKRDERPVPIIGPLHWSLLVDTIKNVCSCMLYLHRVKKLGLPDPSESSSDYYYDSRHHGGEIWRNVAAERKRAILIHVMSALFILVKRGYAIILNSKISKEMALKDRLVDQMLRLVQEKTTVQPQMTDAAFVAKAMSFVTDYKDVLDGRGGSDSSDNKGSQSFFRYNPSEKKNAGAMKNIEILDRDKSNFAELFLSSSGSNTHPSTLYNNKNLQDSLIWMLENLGLAGGVRGCGTSYNREPIDNTIYDILCLVSAGSTGDKNINIYLQSISGLLGLEENSSLTAFRLHLLNYLAGEEIAHQELRDTISHRIFGYAISSSSGSNHNTAAFTSTIDVVLGPRQC